MSLNSVNFDFESTQFLTDCRSDLVNAQGEKCRDGSGRAVVFHETQIPLVYTLEAHYARGKHINNLQKRFDIKNGKFLENQNDLVQNSKSDLYGNINTASNGKMSPAPDFTPEIWKDVGCSVLYALLDYDGINPISRLVSSQDEKLGEAVDKIRQELKQEIIER